VGDAAGCVVEYAPARRGPEEAPACAIVHADVRALAGGFVGTKADPDPPFAIGEEAADAVGE
jgi:hypothetical protein